MRGQLALLISSLVALPACGGKTATVRQDNTVVATPPAPVVSQPTGGMWMPQQLPHHADVLRALGLELDPKVFADPTSAPLAAIVSLGGCSASFVSPEGLIVTNYHCVRGALQYHSTPSSNLVETGFLAKTRAEEKWNGPTSRVYVTRKFVEVTDRVLAGIEGIADHQARYDEIEKRTKELLAACEKDRPHIRCTVASYFRGARFFQIEMLEIRDVRLVYAPHRGIGEFGGDQDNWMWPRHTGDYGFYRAYVGPDGQPADHSAENVPYRPEHYLRVATTPLGEGDLVMVAGYPGRTFRYRTAAEVRDAVAWRFPRTIERYGEYIEALERVGKTDADAAVKAQSWISGLQNGLKYTRGLMDGLVKGGLAEDKERLEAELRAWIAADAERSRRFGGVLDEMEALEAEMRKTRVRDGDYHGLMWGSLLGAARGIVRMAEERPKPDAERDPRYQQRNWKRMEGRARAMPRRYNRNLDRAVMALSLERATRNATENAEWLPLVLGPGATGKEAIAQTLDRLYGGTVLEDVETRLKLLREATTEELRASEEPFIQLALALREFDRELEARSERHAGAMALLKPRYMHAVLDYKKGMVAPDANGTLRVTFGTVQGFRPTPDAKPYAPFTTLPQVLAKHRGEPPFDVPEPLRAAAAKGQFGPYLDAKLGQVPVNFLASLDTTGGNSGSATLNARGELVGLLFDGNYESMASDWLFIPELTRSIHADIRYVLWIMDAVDGADHLIEEMGLTPSL